MKTEKVSNLNGSPEQKTRLEPEMISLYSWNGTEFLKDPLAEDGFKNIIHSLNGDFSLLKDTNLKPIDIERLVALSTGSAQSENWYDVSKHDHFISDVSEIKLRTATLP